MWPSGVPVWTWERRWGWWWQRAPTLSWPRVTSWGYRTPIARRWRTGLSVGMDASCSKRWSKDRAILSCEVAVRPPEYHIRRATISAIRSILSRGSGALRLDGSWCSAPPPTLKGKVPGTPRTPAGLRPCNPLRTRSRVVGTHARARLDGCCCIAPPLGGDSSGDTPDPAGLRPCDPFRTRSRVVGTYTRVRFDRRGAEAGPPGLVPRTLQTPQGCALGTRSGCVHV